MKGLLLAWLSVFDLKVNGTWVITMFACTAGRMASVRECLSCRVVISIHQLSRQGSMWPFLTGWLWAVDFRIFCWVRKNNLSWLWGVCDYMCILSRQRALDLPFFLYFFSLIFIFGCAGSLLLLCGLAFLVAASRGYSSLQCVGFSSWWRLVAEHRL